MVISIPHAGNLIHDKGSVGMGHWGVKSYEIDEAADALDTAFEAVHGQTYVELMEDDNPLTVEQIQKKLANPQTLAGAVEALREQIVQEEADWDEVERLAFAGIIVRHAEIGIPIPDEWKTKAIDWLEHEEIEWDEDTERRLRREKEIALLRGT
jgi:hypothetical protein